MKAKVPHPESALSKRGSPTFPMIRLLASASLALMVGAWPTRSLNPAAGKYSSTASAGSCLKGPVVLADYGLVLMVAAWPMSPDGLDKCAPSLTGQRESLIREYLI